MKLANRIESYIARERLLVPGCRVVVGLSGGADSVALLAILCQLGYDCVACHCNFMLRGEESVRDRNHAQRIAERLHATFIETIFDTTTYAQEHGISIEMAARELRYTWFEQMRIEHHAQAIAVAHHRDDNTETVLLNLTRGTGLAGLTGMQPHNGNIVRPLLCASRDEIIEYLTHEQLDYVTDSTNLEAIYTRNKLRLEVIPMLREINPAFDNSMERTIGYLQGSEKFYRTCIEEWKHRTCRQEGDNIHIDLSQLHTSPAPATLLFEIVSPLGFNATQIEAMATEGIPSGRQFISPTHRAISHRDELVITPATEPTEGDVLATWREGESHTQHDISLSYHPAEGYAIARNSNIACFDLDKVKFPLTLRRWRQGDTFVPFGMRGRKKVSDYFNDHKYSLIEKEQALLLCDSEKILWIVGQRPCNDARIAKHTTQVIELKLLK